MKSTPILVVTALVLVSVVDTPVHAQAKKVDPCTLVTQAEVEEAVGKKVRAPESRPNGCWYGEDIAVYFATMYPASASEFQAAVKKEIDKLNERMRKNGFKETTIEPVEGLGVPALYTDPTLLLWREGRVLAILADRPQAEKIAARLLPRWK